MDQWNWEDSIENLLYKSIPFLIVPVESNHCLLLYFQLYTKEFNLHFISDFTFAQFFNANLSKQNDYGRIVTFFFCFFMIFPNSPI